MKFLQSPSRTSNPLLLQAFLWFLYRSTSSAAAPYYKKYIHPEKCGVYLAESTIPGAGLGMYAGYDVAEGELVTDGDIVISLSELSWNNEHSDFFWLWDEYTWSYNLIPELGFGEVDTLKDLNAASPGIGAAINCMLELVNVDATECAVDNAGLHRSKDPGAGAITPFYNRASKAYRSIEAGQELFIDYGENYFIGRTYKFGLIPLSADHKVANRIMRNYMARRDRLWPRNAKKRQEEDGDPNATLSEELYDDLWNSIVKNFKWESRVFTALPDSRHEVDHVMKDLGGSANRYVERSQRSLEWLEENGACMDHITTGLSTIPQAGRGAFATRFLKKGTVVAPAPLIHIPNRSVLDMFDELPPDEEGFVLPDKDKLVHSQLLLNYCFGHPNTTMLLSPYGVLTNLINHDHASPNTELRWTKNMRRPDWLEKSPDELTEYSYSGLSLDYVALREIEAGEEITVDYGSEWEEAWQQHVRDWKPPDGADVYMPAYELNGLEHIDDPIPTMREQWDQGGTKILWLQGDYYNLFGLETEEAYLRCIVVDRYLREGSNSGDYYYMALTMTITAEDAACGFEWGSILWDLPRDAFIWDDVTYTRDHQKSWSFRHEMRLPDRMLPAAWQNRNPVTGARIEDEEEDVA